MFTTIEAYLEVAANNNLNCIILFLAWHVSLIIKCLYSFSGNFFVSVITFYPMHTF